MSLLFGAITIGLILALLSLGIFISFKIFNFADITAEGSVTLGASVAAALIVSGTDPFIATIAAMAAGFVAGTLTGVIHTKFNINGLLSGILVMTALYSVNLHIMGKSNLPLLSEETVITRIEKIRLISSSEMWILIFILMAVCFTGLLLYLFLKTNIGTSMRATGNNPQMIRALGVNTKIMITLGLAIANALIALSGAILAQYQGFADVQMGIGMLVWGLASVIIGEALVGDKSIGSLIAGAILGSVIFRLLVAIALRWGMNPNDLKLITAVFVFIALILPRYIKKFKTKSIENVGNK
jgi:putative ABC transport system permease protein